MKTATPSVHPTPTRRYVVVGEHSARCVREKHPDWAHGMDHCMTGRNDRDRCDCEAHWREDRSSRLGQ